MGTAKDAIAFTKMLRPSMSGWGRHVVLDFIKSMALVGAFTAMYSEWILHVAS